MSVGVSTRPRADQDLRGPTGGHLPPRALAPVRPSLAFRRHLSLPLGASQFDAGDAPPQPLGHRRVRGQDPGRGGRAAGQGLGVLLPQPWQPPVHHRLPYHSNATSGSGPRQQTVSHLRVHLCLAAALRQVLAGYEHPPGFIRSAPASLHIRGQRIGNPEMHFSRDELIGSAFIAFGITLFVCFFYVAIVSKLLPPYENRFLAAIQEDCYYCLLVPLTLPVIIVAVYLHWLSMKMFKHA